MHFQVARESPQAFGKDGNVNAPDELMAVIDVEDQNARRIRSALLLGAIGHAEVKIPFRFGLGGRKSGDVDEDHDQRGKTTHGGNCNVGDGSRSIVVCVEPGVLVESWRTSREPESFKPRIYSIGRDW